MESDARMQLWVAERNEVYPDFKGNDRQFAVADPCVTLNHLVASSVAAQRTGMSKLPFVIVVRPRAFAALLVGATAVT